jgi:hypothetical protein
VSNGTGPAVAGVMDLPEPEWVEVPDCLFCKGTGWVPEWQDVCPSDGHRTEADRTWWMAAPMDDYEASCLWKGIEPQRQRRVRVATSHEAAA